MQSKVGRWGNSLAVRLPKDMAAEAGLVEGGAIELVIDAGTIAIKVVEPEVPGLEQLLAGITPENLHAPIETGGAMGGEVW